ncbi:hypothetical protein KDK95_17610 [Actinospica sp. MGRD01-02]|uniref:Uncharacterized protein n=1 Tax=Actinospica acidithermotolerans TaxID=2828514 RepID=A0A941EI95_9ACTN|nr:hypothetical protein [Actinospica acidithermotolerans]MBR7828139.1 hypothetical protein [Actinospica acidithermotolerans]
MTAHSHGAHASPNVVVECQALITAPYRIVANSTWYSQGKITECSSPPPTSCSLSVDMQELVNNEYGGQSWQTVSAAGGNPHACAVGYTVTPSYTCLSNLANHDFRSYGILIVTASTTGESTWTSGTESIPCE